MTDSIPTDAKRLRLAYDISCKECSGTGSAFTDSDGTKWPHRLCDGKGEITVVTNIELERVRIKEVGYESVTFRPDMYDAIQGWSGLLREVE